MLNDGGEANAPSAKFKAGQRPACGKRERDCCHGPHGRDYIRQVQNGTHNLIQHIERDGRRWTGERGALYCWRALSLYRSSIALYSLLGLWEDRRLVRRGPAICIQHPFSDSAERERLGEDSGTTVPSGHWAHYRKQQPGSKGGLRKQQPCKPPLLCDSARGSATAAAAISVPHAADSS